MLQILMYIIHSLGVDSSLKQWKSTSAYYYTVNMLIIVLIYDQYRYEVRKYISALKC